MPRRKTDAEFRQEVRKFAGNKYTIVGQYVNCHTKIAIKHNTCGRIFNMTPMTFLKNHGHCPCERKNHRKTDAEFKQLVRDAVGNEYTFLEPYHGSTTKIKVRHNRCGHIYAVTPSSFLRDHARCWYCFKKKRSLTLKQFKQKVSDRVGDEYTIISNSYINNRAPIKIRHNRCGYTYEIRPHDFLQGRRCPSCLGRVKISHEEFKQQVYNLVGDEYTVLGQYTDKSTPVKVRHNTCRHVYDVAPREFFKGARCRPCMMKKAGLRKRLTQEQFQQRIDAVHGQGRYTLLAIKRTMTTRNRVVCKVKCNTCKNIFVMSPDALIQGSNCPKCARKLQSKQMTKTDTQFKCEVKALVGNEYTILGKYQNSQINIKVKHNACRYVYDVTPARFLTGSRCPRCTKQMRMSRGETAVMSILTQLNYQRDIDYYYGYVLPNRLHLDFYLPRKRLAIEYDGAQHFVPTAFFIPDGSDETPESRLATQQERDQRKDQYCKDHDIELIRIPYTITSHKKIFNIIKEQLGYH